MRKFKLKCGKKKKPEKPEKRWSNNARQKNIKEKGYYRKGEENKCDEAGDLVNLHMCM